MLKIAHRGYSAQAPENTLAAFRAALPEHPDGVEFDVHVSADGVPVIIHDHRLERTTNGTGEVRAHTLAELKTLDAGGWFAPAFAGERIPTLREALELLRGAASPYIELKAPGTPAPTVALLHELEMAEQAVIMSFSAELVAEVLALDPRLTARLLVATDGSDHPEDAWRAGAHCAGVTHLSVLHDVLTPTRVDELHADGYDIIAWTVDDAERMRALIAMGIEGIITNQIGRLMRIAADA